MRLEGVTVGVWGLTFKANTDDRRDSPSLQVAHRLAALGATGAGLRPDGEPGPATWPVPTAAPRTCVGLLAVRRSLRGGHGGGGAWRC